MNVHRTVMQPQYQIQPQNIEIPDVKGLEEEIQQRINLAKQESKHLYAQINKVKAKSQDADLFDMAKRIENLNKNSINLKPTLTLKGHNNKISDFRWSYDSKYVLSSSQDGFMIIWDTATGLKQNAIPLDSQWVLSCAISPSGRFVASAGLNNNCTVYRISKENRVQQNIVSIFKGHTAYISDIEFQDNSKVITASGDMTCALWDISKAKRVREYADHLGDVLSLSLPAYDSEIPNNIFASSGSDGYTYIWDVRTPASVQSFFSNDIDVNTTSFLRNGNSVATGSDDGTITVWDLRSDCSIAKYSLAKSIFKNQPTYMQSSMDYSAQSPRSQTSGHFSSNYLDNQGVISIDFSKSGRLMFACYTDSGCIIWDTLKGEVVGTLDGHSNRISGVKASPDGLAVCTGSWDSLLKVWSPMYV